MNETFRNPIYVFHKEIAKECKWKYSQDVVLESETIGDIELPGQIINLEFCKLTLSGCSYVNCPFIGEEE